ncbi:hypothetical protein GOV13_01825 [Candidatus Pacearchaeota archaeon]|nr:hypothetical protein [Candidatus Pacearchaeota archaeon]
MKKSASKKGQMKLSFGMIFSIILILVFMVLAFFVIKKFLEFQEGLTIKQFTNKLQQDIDKIWQGDQGSQKVEYFLPSKIDAICFKNDDYENLRFRSGKLMDGEKINHLDIEKITEDEDPYCIESEDGKVKFVLEKDFGENLVIITR